MSNSCRACLGRVNNPGPPFGNLLVLSVIFQALEVLEFRELDWPE